MQSKGAEKWKNKQWFDVRSPVVLGSEIVGSIPADSSDKVKGRVIKVSLSWLTHNPAHSFLTVGMRIVGAENNVANTELAFLESQFSYLHSLVRRHSDTLYTYDALKDKNGASLVAKFLLTTQHNTTASKRTELRKALSAYLQSYLSKNTKDDFIKSLLSNEFRQDVIKLLSRIYPIAKFEIKRIEL